MPRSSSPDGSSSETDEPEFELKTGTVTLSFSPVKNPPIHLQTCRDIKDGNCNGGYLDVARNGPKEQDPLSLDKCIVCGMPAVDKESLLHHTISHLEGSSDTRLGEKCPKCKETLDNFSDLKEHFIFEHIQFMFIRCNFCKTQFQSRSGFVNHRLECFGLAGHPSGGKRNKGEPGVDKEPAPIRNIQCQICNEAFDTLASIGRHLGVDHAKKRRLHAAKCRLDSAAQSHPVKNRAKKLHSCDVCKKSFKRSDGLKSHVATHSFVKFKCKICDAGLSTKYSLDAHEKTHREGCRWICEFCAKCFASSTNLRYHLMTHGNQRPFQCVTCGKRFLHRGVLNQHVVSHTASKTFACDECGNTFAHQRYLSQHKRIHTRKPYNCTICDQVFQRIGQLKEHLQCHISNVTSLVRFDDLEEPELCL